MRTYRLYNNILGWICFVIAAITYLMTVEPTASFWDCPEFISQAYKLEVGHPPGNPIFMLAGRFFVNFAGGDVSKIALAVNSMSALLSAGTILLLFWTITHFVKKLTVADDAERISLNKMLLIYGSGLCGALMYTWSDTFWFSAVEGEVYAFSSFCTALVIWLILKWENRADEPGSDRNIVLIAYVIGISIAVHLLNLLCIPAIALIVYYRKYENTSAKGSLITLGVSAIIVALILFGLVPGFIGIAQYFELFFVNVVGWSYNSGVMVYALLLVASLIWTIYNLYVQKDVRTIRCSFMCSILLSGIPFLGGNLWIGIVLLLCLGFYLWNARRLPVRILTLTSLAVLVMFVGYSSYALLLIRSGANPPMNQNAPDNVFALGSYLNREQYGENPLFYGQSFNSSLVYQINDRSGSAGVYTTKGKTQYSKVVKKDSSEPDKYVSTGEKITYHWSPNMLFPRMYSTNPGHPEAYMEWGNFSEQDMKNVIADNIVDSNGKVLDPYQLGYQRQMVKVPTMAQNLRYFVNYQLMYMYWRYFMWNFAGRQNDIQGQGEPNRGNWISGIPFIDNPRLGDQSLLPYDMGKGNKGHNVFYMLPLIMGLFGLCWQAFVSKRGIEQFWVVFFLFFMTGVAIVLYLNQPPLQPRERDYAFAGSFYAYAIWVGMGVAAIGSWLKSAMKVDAKQGNGRHREFSATVSAAIAFVIGLIVPAQVVSQTWDDHDRSGRYTTRDFGMNYLSSVDENGIIFTNGDNDTFPLWYAQEVEGYRQDVRVVNLSYLTTDWYANQLTHPYYESAAVEMLATPDDYAYDKLQYVRFADDTGKKGDADARIVLENLYADAHQSDGYPTMGYKKVFIPVDIDASVSAGVINPGEEGAADSYIRTELPSSGMYLSGVLALDMLATSAANGWNRPVYFAMTVPNSYYLGLDGNMRNTGLAYQVGPIYTPLDGYDMAVNSDKMYRNVTEKFRWGGLDKLGENDEIYLDETVRRMVTTHRSAMLDLASALFNEGVEAKHIAEDKANYYSDTLGIDAEAYSADRFAKSLEILDLMIEKLPEKHAPLGLQVGEQTGQLYLLIGDETGNTEATEKGLQILYNEILRYSEYIPYFADLRRRNLYSSLSRTDRYAQQYLMSLIRTFYAGGGDIDLLEVTLKDKGVSLKQLIEEEEGIRRISIPD